MIEKIQLSRKTEELKNINFIFYSATVSQGNHNKSLYLLTWFELPNDSE